MNERPIKKPLEFKALMESLIGEDKVTKEAPFSTHAKIMAFSASIGAKLRPQDFNKNYRSDGNPIKFYTFKNGDFDGIINILAVYKTNSLSVLTSEGEQKDKKIAIFEGYAYAGLKKLQSIVDRPGMTLDNLIEFIKEHIEDKKENQEGEINLQSLLS